MKVRQLDWIGDIEEDEEISAEGLMGMYTICPSNHGYGDLWSAIFNGWHSLNTIDSYDGEIGVHATVEKAKEHCQNHHEKRVKQALKFVEEV